MEWPNQADIEPAEGVRGKGPAAPGQEYSCRTW